MWKNRLFPVFTQLLAGSKNFKYGKVNKNKVW